jgi:hypothetical protein
MTGAAKAGQDLVGDKQNPMLVAAVSDTAEPPRWRRKHTLTTDNRLQDDRADVVTPAQDLVECPQPTGIRQPANMGVEMLGKGLAELWPRGGMESTEGEAVVRGIEGDDPRATGRQQGGFERDLHGVGPGDGKVDLRVVHRHPPAEAFGQTNALWMCLDVSQTVEKSTRLTADGRHHPWVSVANGRDAKAGGQIQEAIAVDIQDVRTLGLLPQDVGRGGAQSVDTGSFRARQGTRQFSGPGPGRWREDLGEKVSPGKACHCGSAVQRRQISRLPASERARVTSSVYSM